MEKIHHEVANEMLCKRHEIHPMYASDYAEKLETIGLDEYRKVVNEILDYRNKDIWILFGTLPFYPCSQDERDLELIKRLNSEPNITTRNDVDGRSRMNLNIFTGDISVSDFTDDGSAFGNIKNESLNQIYDRWLDSNISKSINCHCPAVKCLGPNVIVKNMYYPNKEFISGLVK